jgi:hypothetical protein
MTFHSIRLRTRIVLDKRFFLWKLCRSWGSVEKYGRARQPTDDNIIWRMRIACWITKATDTHSECIILIAFPWQQWLRERSSVLRYTYIACLIVDVKSVMVPLLRCVALQRLFVPSCGRRPLFILSKWFFPVMLLSLYLLLCILILNIAEMSEYLLVV